jgi:hypothetical protein
MKASDLIKLLQRAIEREGDLPLACPDGMVKDVRFCACVDGVEENPRERTPNELFMEIVAD